MIMKNLLLSLAATSIFSLVFDSKAMVATRGVMQPSIKRNTAIMPYTMPGRVVNQPVLVQRKFAQNNSQDEHGFIGRLLERAKLYFQSRPQPLAATAQPPVLELPNYNQVYTTDDLKPGFLMKSEDPYLQWIQIQEETEIDFPRYALYLPLFDREPQILRELAEIKRKKDQLNTVGTFAMKRTPLYTPQSQHARAMAEQLKKEIYRSRMLVNKQAQAWREKSKKPLEQLRQEAVDRAKMIIKSR